MLNVILYHTDGCHLCEQAYELLIAAGVGENLTLIDILQDEALVTEYQTSIPVAQFSSGAKLFWPFNLQDILNNK
jgi:hypothetical protein